ncbi:unnamed protein product [Brachionus calyciflorus]|uniref:DOMON domain-containing protein n=1 Tax=Brachionus calyciflorus TaxID=104777 RepID=A0A813TE87_9BILA|nr:unnamed protein product [Brachionus calyciflorus]
MLKLFFKLILLIILINKIHLLPNPQINANKYILVEPDLYILYWDHNTTDINFEIHVKTNGWISFGLSRHGDMEYSDVIVTWLKPDGSFNFTDRHILQEKKPKIDSEQNWFPLSLKQQNDYMIAIFTRKIQTNSKNNEDIDIAVGSPFVVYAWGTNFDPDISYHGPKNRGQVGINLLKTSNQINPNKTQIIEYKINDSLINGYYCQLFENKNNIFEQDFKFEALISPGNENFVHHIGLNECSVDLETEYLKKNDFPVPGPCYLLNSQINKWTEVTNFCQNSRLMWSDYNIPKIQNYTSDIFNVKSKSKYVMIYVHHYNPENRLGN